LSDQESSALINFYPFTNLTAKKVKTIITKIKEGLTLESLSDYPEDNILYRPNEDERTIFFKPHVLGQGLRKLKSLSPEDVIEFIKESKLSGRGGAFFPTGTKWQFCRNNAAEQKYIICNADEGEPGTFKDRVLINTHPELLIEGMAIADYAAGATEGYIYLRAEYAYLKQKINNAITALKKAKLLGKDILGIKGFDFNVHLFMGAGAYICGEETALIASMEGKRGEPTTKAYFPVEKGYLGKPTVVNKPNILSFVTVPILIPNSPSNACFTSL